VRKSASVATLAAPEAGVAESTMTVAPTKLNDAVTMPAKFS
jgi:hypothetical protein